MNIDISDIKSFVSVAELKSISAAAQQLNYLQSNMTAKIKKIEHHYKRPLFIRKPKGVELTAAGIDLYAQYKKMMFTWEETETKIYQQEMYLRFGTNASLGAMRFYPCFKQLYESYPKLRITLKTAATGDIEDEILQGNIDIAYILGQAKHKQIQYIAKGQDELVLIGKDLINHQGFAACLADQHIILSSEKCCYWGTLKQIYADLNLKQGEITLIHDTEALIHFTQLGMGISVIPKSLAKRYNIEYYRDMPEQYRTIGLYLIARSEHIFTPLEKQFIGLNDAI